MSQLKSGYSNWNIFFKHLSWFLSISLSSSEIRSLILRIPRQTLQMKTCVSGSRLSPGKLACLLADARRPHSLTLGTGMIALTVGKVCFLMQRKQMWLGETWRTDVLSKRLYWHGDLSDRKLHKLMGECSTSFFFSNSER